MRDFGYLPDTKAGRHALIGRVLAEQTITSQRELLEALSHHGVNTTQATLSRDLEELRATKIRRAGGTSTYVLPNHASGRLDAPDVSEDVRAQLTAALQRSSATLLLGAEAAGNLVVLRTPTAGAQLLAAHIDQSVLPGLLGCVAGDDTVLLVARTQEDAQQLVEKLLSLARRTPRE